jgi:hypothetical protein
MEKGGEGKFNLSYSHNDVYASPIKTSGITVLIWVDRAAAEGFHNLSLKCESHAVSGAMRLINRVDDGDWHARFAD